MKEGDVSNGRIWWLWLSDWCVYHVLPVPDMFVSGSWCSITACDKVTFRLNRQLMKHRALWEIYTFDSLPEPPYNKKQVQVLAQAEKSNITVDMLSPCAVSGFRPPGGNFWEAPSSVRHCSRKIRSNPKEKKQQVPEMTIHFVQRNIIKPCSQIKVYCLDVDSVFTLLRSCSSLILCLYSKQI